MSAVRDGTETETGVRIQLGYELVYECPSPTPMVLMLKIHDSHAADIVVPDHMVTTPGVPLEFFQDEFGNCCSRLIAPPGQIRITTDALVTASGQPEPVALWAQQTPVELLPDDTLRFLRGSRYCETDRLTDIAWQLFAHTPPGWARVQAIVDYVHRHLTFGYQFARATRTAWEAHQERVGVCRDFAHLAVALCRCMNIPARYCTGYLGDIGVPRCDAPMDFSGWFEAYLDGVWYTFDARHNMPRIGRVLIARGRDAADVAISTSFGQMVLRHFCVRTDEVPGS
jgi:transglutaminase-like putative cysteine protease